MLPGREYDQPKPAGTCERSHLGSRYGGLRMIEATIKELGRVAVITDSRWPPADLGELAPEILAFLTRLISWQ